MKRPIKLLLSITICLLIIFSAIPSHALSGKVQWLVDQGIISGRKTNSGVDYALDESIQRDEMTKLLVQYAGKGDRAKRTASDKSPFSDVEVSHWANGYINVAMHESMISGFPDGTFHPKSPVTYAQVASMLVRLDDRWTQDMTDKAVWPYSYLRTAAEYGILTDVNFSDANLPATRKDAFHMLFNAIHSQNHRIYVNFDFQDPDLDQTPIYDVALGQPLGVRFPMAPSRTGFTFIGWNTQADGSGSWVNASTPFHAGATVYAIWEEDGITIRYIEEYPIITIPKNEYMSPDDVSLPTYLTLYLSNNRPVKVPITWNREPLILYESGNYQLDGQYELPKEVTSGPKPQATIKIIVK